MFARQKKYENPKFKEDEEQLRLNFTKQVKEEENRFRQWESQVLKKKKKKKKISTKMLLNSLFLNAIALIKILKNNTLKSNNWKASLSICINYMAVEQSEDKHIKLHNELIIKQLHKANNF
jgi:hypothetical protein